MGFRYDLVLYFSKKLNVCDANLNFWKPELFDLMSSPVIFPCETMDFVLTRELFLM